MFHSAKSNHVLLQAQQMLPPAQLIEEVEKGCLIMEGRQIAQIILQPLTSLLPDGPITGDEHELPNPKAPKAKEVRKKRAELELEERRRRIEEEEEEEKRKKKEEKEEKRKKKEEEEKKEAKKEKEKKKKRRDREERDRKRTTGHKRRREGENDWAEDMKKARRE